MTHKWILGLCAIAAFVTLASKPVVHQEPQMEIALMDDQLASDPETIKFIQTYMQHGWQFDPE